MPGGASAFDVDGKREKLGEKGGLGDPLAAAQLKLKNHWETVVNKLRYL